MHDRRQRGSRCADRRPAQRAAPVYAFFYMPPPGAVPASSPAEPAGRRRHDDDRPGRDGAVRDPPGDRHAEPRHLPDRRAVRPGAAVRAVGNAAGLEPQAVLPFGANCGRHTRSRARRAERSALSRGFMVATSSMNVLGSNCNTVVSAESVMMLKERIIERYGDIRYTFGEGCPAARSASSPSPTCSGLLQGLIPSATYPDVAQPPLSRSSTAIYCFATSLPSPRTCGPIPRSKPR